MPSEQAGFHKGSCHTYMQKILALFPTIINHEQQRQVSKGHPCPVQQVADTLPLPPPALGEGGAECRVQPGPWRYTSAGEQLLQTQQIPCLTEAFRPAKVPRLKSHTHTYDKVSWERYSLAFFSWHSSVTSSCQDSFLGQLEHGTGSAGVASTQQQFRHIAPSLSVCPCFLLSPGSFSPPTKGCDSGVQRGHFHASPTTTPLGWDPATPCEADGKGKKCNFETVFCKLTLSVSP